MHRALFYIPKLDREGPQKVFGVVASHLGDWGVECTVLVHEPGGLAWDTLPSRVTRYALSVDQRSFPWAAYVRKAREIEPDVIFTTGRTIDISAAARASRVLKVPLIVRPANTITSNFRELARRSMFKHKLAWACSVLSLHAADHIVAQSNVLQADFYKYSVRKDKITVIGNPVIPSDLELAPRGAAPSSLSLVAIGRLTHQKGFDILIEAISRIRKINGKVHLRIVGDGEDRAILEAKIGDLGIGSNVELVGYRNDINKIIDSADFVINSSRYEGFPNAALEALSRGVPVIGVAGVGGIEELVITGKTGWIAQSHNSEHIADAILAASSFDGWSRSEVRRSTLEKYNVGTIVGQYADLISKMTRLRDK
ncbi:MAG: glycosyltransferase [Mesorhizobium sp.]|nr:MAG: glycosyltransferase [Mesorhizobium sp.]TJV47196.1 MAG: glycosyltransferase [Mesorhizobium sp.]